MNFCGFVIFKPICIHFDCIYVNGVFHFKKFIYDLFLLHE